MRRFRLESSRESPSGTAGEERGCARGAWQIEVEGYAQDHGLVVQLCRELYLVPPVVVPVVLVLPPVVASVHRTSRTPTQRTRRRGGRRGFGVLGTRSDPDPGEDGRWNPLGVVVERLLTSSSSTTRPTSSTSGVSEVTTSATGGPVTCVRGDCPTGTGTPMVRSQSQLTPMVTCGGLGWTDPSGSLRRLNPEDPPRTRNSVLFTGLGPPLRLNKVLSAGSGPRPRTSRKLVSEPVDQPQVSLGSETTVGIGTRQCSTHGCPRYVWVPRQGL